jgi:hypothetical protein
VIDKPARPSGQYIPLVFAVPDNIDPTPMPMQRSAGTSDSELWRKKLDKTAQMRWLKQLKNSAHFFTPEIAAQRKEKTPNRQPSVAQMDARVYGFHRMPESFDAIENMSAAIWARRKHAAKPSPTTGTMACTTQLLHTFAAQCRKALGDELDHQAGREFFVQLYASALSRKLTGILGILDIDGEPKSQENLELLVNAQTVVLHYVCESVGIDVDQTHEFLAKFSAPYAAVPALYLEALGSELGLLPKIVAKHRQVKGEKVSELSRRGLDMAKQFSEMVLDIGLYFSSENISMPEHEKLPLEGRNLRVLKAFLLDSTGRLNMDNASALGDWMANRPKPDGTKVNSTNTGPTGGRYLESLCYFESVNSGGPEAPVRSRIERKRAREVQVTTTDMRVSSEPVQQTPHAEVQPAANLVRSLADFAARPEKDFQDWLDDTLGPAPDQ